MPGKYLFLRTAFAAAVLQDLILLHLEVYSGVLEAFTTETFA